jgi:serine/threonine-protein kinase
MGIVYRAEDEKLRRTVALKVLPEDFDDDAHRRKRFLREARVAAAIAHPNVAAIHEVGEADGRVYIAMELASGTTLRKRLDGGALSVDESLRIARDIARGVGRAHARSIAHRDLKPDNVMVSDDGAVKVLDFGLAKPMELAPSSGDDAENVTVTQEGRIIGTPGYMSPEQARGAAIDVRTDVFSMGVMLYEMLTGTRPFSGSTSMDTLIATSRDGYTPASRKNPRVPAAIDRVIAKCLEKEPAERYATAEELLAALEAVRMDAPAGSRVRNLAIVAIATVAIGVGLWRMNAAGADSIAAKPSEPPPPRIVVDPTPLTAAASASTIVESAPKPSDPKRVEAPPRGGVAIARPPAAPPKPSAAVSAAPAVTPTESPGGGVIQKSPY